MCCVLAVLAVLELLCTVTIIVRGDCVPTRGLTTIEVG